MFLTLRLYKSKTRLKFGEDCDVRYYYPQDFKILSKIGFGGFSSVHVAEWKDTRTKLAIKKFAKNFTEEKIINEIKLMRMVDFHSNVIGFCGVTKFEDENRYSLVLEYADGGTLGKYLRNNATNFRWESQLEFAREIAGAISCLHNHNIIHRDLHPNNVLIHRNSIKLADFGRSSLQGSNFQTKVYGVIPYVDPNIFKNQESESRKYDLTEKSDIYSLGVLLWELTSCSSPFNFENLDNFHERERIKLVILGGARENPVKGTNRKFVELYKKCWKLEPDERPDIHQVISVLDHICPKDNGGRSINSNSKRIEVFEMLDVLDDFSDCDLSKYNY